MSIYSVYYCQHLTTPFFFFFGIQQNVTRPDPRNIYSNWYGLSIDRSHLRRNKALQGMTRVTFGVSTSSFAANMAVKQNAIDHAYEYPLAADAVEKSF